MATCSINPAGAEIALKPSPEQKPPSRTWMWLADTYGLDVRSLAVFRVALGLLIIGDLISRAVDLRAFYTDWGTLPRFALLEKFADQWVLSIHLMSGRAEVQTVLFLLAAIFAFFMMVGWRTRLFTFLSWFMLGSLQARNPVILQGGDALFRMILFWAMFLPLGAVHSVDAALDKSGEKPPKKIFSAGSIGLMAQIAMLYW